MERRLSVVMSADLVGYSAMVDRDDSQSIGRLQQLWNEHLSGLVQSMGGRVIKMLGDGYLLEFASAAQAVECAIRWQSLCASHGRSATDADLSFRIGINLGDLLIDGDDAYGNGVNIAVRIESVCPPGKVCVSEAVKAAVGGNTKFVFESIGRKRLKNIADPLQLFVVSESAEARPGEAYRFSIEDQSKVRYCAAKDGVSLAYATVGKGYPLVLAGSWLSHLEKDWENPGFRGTLATLASHFEIIRYDQRGNGMSDWEVPEISFESLVDDLEVIIDHSGHERVALYGPSQAASVSIAYAVRHPEKVSHLILHGGYARGRRRRNNPEDAAESEALVALIRKGWGGKNPAFRQMMTSIFMPGASPEEIEWFNEFQRATASPENAARFRELFDEMDVSELLPEVRTPTLVIHSNGDTAAPIAEGKFLASRIPGAEFTMLDSDNHMIFENEPDFPKFISAIRAFATG